MGELNLEEFKDVFLNEYGFYELKNKPTADDRKQAFENEYYQEGISSSYEKVYSDEQLRNMTYKFREKELMIRKYIHDCKQTISVLDIGCGEGFFVSYFAKQGYEVCGIDYSIYGVKTQNPDIEDLIIQGDSSEIIKEFIKENKKFDVINMDSVLDMMIEPKETLDLCKQLLANDGVFIVKVANNYSELQKKLLQSGKLSKEFWLDNPGHPYYFNKDGFTLFFEKMDLSRLIYMESRL